MADMDGERQEDAGRLWAGALDELRLQMARATFDAGLRGSRVVASAPGALTVEVMLPHATGWLQHRLRATVERTVARLAGRPVTVTFVAAPPDPGSEPEAEVPAPLPDEPPAGEGSAAEEARPARPGRALGPADFYIRLKIAFRQQALGRLKGAPLSVFMCLSLHVDDKGLASPGIETIMRETRYSRGVVCNALAKLVRLGLISKQESRRHGTEVYAVNAYAWYGRHPAPALWEK